MRASIFFSLSAVLVSGFTAQSSDTTLVWPSLPERARIKHVQTVSSLQNLEGKKSFFSRVLNFFTGSEKAPPWLVQPVGIAVAPDGRMYVTDPGAKGVHVVDLKAQQYEFMAATKTGSFLSPVGVAVADDGTVYISDSQRGSVVALAADHDFKFAIADRLQRPTGLSIAHDRLYVTDAGRHAIVLFDLKGKYVSEFGQRGAGAGEFNFPISITARSPDASELFVVDALNYRVQEFDSAGRFLSTFGQQGNVAGRLASPKAIALDADGDLYVTDALMDNLQIFDPTGKLLLIVGHSGMRDGEFSSPNGIAIDRDNRIYVIETLNRRIQIFQYVR